ncbi:MAG: pentapeptide repeat-containing protein [Candidatus Burarchaeum sp.]|nr:pentapeptide repeat-containing protein [Candidatus Burarchaeum sp.]MDO8339533.1 pentapeptide repeat-containing protein [Candidatus Burarchaeum sp.]
MKPAPDVNPPSKNGRSKYFRPQKCIDAIRSSTTPATTQMNLGVLALFIKNYAGDLPLDLSGLDLSGLYLPHANLTGANLARTKFIGATLDGADFTGATLTDAIFKNAYLKDAIFPREHADLLSDDQKRQIKEWA